MVSHYDAEDLDLTAAAIKREAASTRPGTSTEDKDNKKKERFANLENVQNENLVRDSE